MKLSEWARAGEMSPGPMTAGRRLASRAIEALGREQDPIVFGNEEWPEGSLITTLAAALKSGFATIVVTAKLGARNSFVESAEVVTTVQPWDGMLERFEVTGDEDGAQGATLTFRGATLTADHKSAVATLIEFFDECTRYSV